MTIAFGRSPGIPRGRGSHSVFSNQDDVRKPLILELTLPSDEEDEQVEEGIDADNDHNSLKRKAAVIRWAEL